MVEGVVLEVLEVVEVGGRLVRGSRGGVVGLEEVEGLSGWWR
jgi:hypothetical protein